MRLYMEELEVRVTPTLYTWTGAHEAASGIAFDKWSDLSNWKNNQGPSLAAPGTAVELQFDNTALAKPNYNDLGTPGFPLLIDQLTIAGGTYTLAGNQFELGSSLSGVGSGTITVNTGIGAETIANPIQFGSSTAVSTEYLLVQSAATLTLTGQLTSSGTATVTEKGPGTVTVSNDNSASFFGPYTIANSVGNGTTIITDPNALGNGSVSTNVVTVNANTELQVNLLASNLTVNVPMVISGSGTNGIDGAIVMNPTAAGITTTLAGAITMNANSTIGVKNPGGAIPPTTTLNINGVISDANVSGYSLTKEGPGTLFLNPQNPLAAANSFHGGNVYHGNTYVNGGELQIGQPYALGVGGAATIVNSNNLESGTLSLNYSSANPPPMPAADKVYAQVQTVTITGAPTFTLSYNGVSTLPIAFGTAAATIQSDLNALSTIGGIGASVTVSAPGTGNVLYILFGGSLGGLEIPTVSATVTSGTGTATVAATTGSDSTLPSTLPAAFTAPIGFIVPNELLTLNGPGLDGIHVNFTNNNRQFPTAGGITTTTGALSNSAGDNAWEGAVTFWSTTASVSQNQETNFYEPAVTIGATLGTNLTIDGAITDNGIGAAGNNYSFSKVGFGRVILTNDNNFTSDIDILNGILNIRDSHALGDVTNLGQEAWWGSTLELQADGIPDSQTGTYNLKIPSTDTIWLDGPGFIYPGAQFGEGALYNVSGVNEIDASVSLQSTEPTTVIGVAPDPDPTNIQGQTWNDLSQLTITGVISDTGNVTTLTKTGYGELVLTNKNTYTGPIAGQNSYETFINQGWITAQNDFALGGTYGNRNPVDQPGVQVLPGAALVLKQDQAGNSITMNYNLSISGNGLSLPATEAALHPYLNETGALESLDGVNTETGSIYLDGIPITFSGSLGNAAQNVLVADYAGTLNGSGGGDAYVGTDIQTLGTSSNNEVQLVDISGNPTSGTFTLSFNGATSPAITWSNNNTTLIANITTALTTLLGAGNFIVGGTNPVAIGVEIDGANSPTYASQLTLTGSLLDPNNNPANTVPAPIAGQLDKVGTQRLVLQGAGVYSGGVNVQTGVLRIQNNNALGTPSATTGNYTTTVQNGAALEIAPANPLLTGGNQQGLQIWYDNLVLNGSGDATFGDAALTVLSNDNLWRGPITLNSDINVAFNVPNSAFFQDAVLTMTVPTAGNLLSGGTVTVADSTPGGSGLSAVQTLNFTSGVTGGTFELTLQDSEQQTLAVAGAGTFALNFTGYPTLSTATLDPSTLTAASLASALNTLLQTPGAPGYVSATDFGSVTVTGAGPYLITFGGNLTGAAGTIVPLLESQTVTGTATSTPAYVTNTTQPIAWSSSLPILVNNIQNAINALSSTFNTNTFTATSLVNAALSTPVIDVFPNSRLTITGSIGDTTNAADLTVNGTGELALAGANTYRGTTYVNQGVLTISNPTALGGTGIAAVQLLTLTGVTAGTSSFTLAFPDGPGGSSYQTLSIPYTGNGATDAGVIQTYLNTLKSITGAGGSVTVTPVSNTQFTISFGGSFVGFNQPLLTPAVTGPGSATVVTQTTGEGGTVVASGAQLQLQGAIVVNGEPLMIQGQGVSQESELQLISAAGTPTGTFTLGFTNPVTQLLSTTTLSVGATAAQVQTALNGLLSVQQGATGAGTAVNPLGNVIVTETGVETYSVLFSGNYVGAQQGLIEPAQILAVSGASGTFTLSLGSATTAALAYNVPATGGAGPTGSIQNALNAILAASGSPGYVSATSHGTVASITVNADGSFTIFFGGTLAGASVPVLVAGNFTGSAAATVNATGVTVFTTEEIAGGTANATPTQWFSSGPAPISSAALTITTAPATNNANISGPITSIAVDPNDGDIIYITTAGGGAWKSINDGTTWTPLFDGVSTVQNLTITGSDSITDTFNLTYTNPSSGATTTTVTLPYNASADQVAAALNAVVGTGNSVSVSQDINTNGKNEVQEIVLNTTASTWTSISADPTFYTRYFLTFNGKQTAAIPYEGNAALDQQQIETALDALTTIGGLTPTAGSVNVTIDPTPPGGLGALTDEGFFITFQGALADAPEPLITFAIGDSVTGGGHHGGGGQFWGFSGPPSPFPTINNDPAFITGPNPPNTTNNSDGGPSSTTGDSLSEIVHGQGPTIVDTITFSGGGLANVNVALMTANQFGAATVTPSLVQQGVGAQAAMFSSSIVVGGYGEPAAASDNILFLGTGVDNNSQDPYYGTGVYESTDYGQTWNLLTDTTLAAPNPLYGMSVNKIVLDPTNNDIYVATSDVGTSTTTGFGSFDTPTITHPGVWRYNLTTGSWLDLTDITSTNRATVTSSQGTPPAYANPPMTPGPDDNYLLTFPQKNASWSDLAITSNPADGGVILYAALGTTGANAANGVYNLTSPASASVAAPPAWFLGSLGSGVDNRSTSQFPTAAGPNYLDDAIPNSFFGQFSSGTGDIGNIKIALITGANGSTLFPVGGGGGAATGTQTNPTAADFVLAAVTEANDANNPAPNESYFIAGSDDSAQDWGLLASQPPNTSGQTYLGNGGNHASAILVTNNDIFVGGSDAGTDGYVYDFSAASGTWLNISQDAAGNGPHTGIQSFAFLGNTLYVGTRDGMWTYNTTTDLWSDINGNLGAAEINSVASDPTNPNIVFGAGLGTGIVQYNGNQNWTQVESNVNTTGNLSSLNTYAVAVDPNNSSNVYAIFGGANGNGGRLTVSTTGGGAGSWSTVYTDPTVNSPALAVDSFSRVFVGGSQLVVFANSQQAALGNFTNLNAPAGNISNIAVADLQGPFAADASFPTVTDMGAQNPDGRTIVITEGATLYVTKDLGVTWISRTDAAWGGNTITSVAIDPSDRDDIWVTLGGAVGKANTGSVWFSSDAGQHWTSINSGLAVNPAGGFVPARSLVIDPRSGTVYLGTDLGVYVLAPGAVRTWTTFAKGSLPMVSVLSLSLNQSNNILTVGTAGRGVFQFYLDTPAANAGALVATSGTDIWNGPVILAGATTISSIGNQNLQNAVAVTELALLGQVSDSTYAASVSGANTLTKSGTGDLTLAAANTYSGLTLINQGDVTVDNPAALGGGAITSSQEFFLAGAVAGTTQFKLSFNGAGPSAAITYTGTSADAAAIQAQLASLINPVTQTVAVTQITPGDYLVTFGGTLANTPVLITATVTAGTGNAFAAVDGTTVVTSGSGLLLDTSLTAEPLYLFGNGAENQSGHFSGSLENVSGINTYTGTITLENNSTIGVDGTSNLTIASPAVGTPAITDLGAAGAFGVQKEGSGTLTLVSSNNYQGGTTINQGVLNVENNNALGLAGTTTTVLDGAQLQLQGYALAGTLTAGSNTITQLPTTVGLSVGQTVSGPGIVPGTTVTVVGPGNQVTISQNASTSTVSTVLFGNVAITTQNLSLSGTGILNTGALENVGGNNTWGAAGTTITLNAVPSFSPVSSPGNVTIGVLNAGETLTLGSVITQPAAGVSSPAAPALTMTGGLTKVGLGKLVLTQSDTYSGTNYINQGIVAIQNAGSLGTANGNEIQRITTIDPGAADSFILSFGGIQTVSIPFGATAATVANDLGNLGSIGTGNVTVAENFIPSGISQVETETLTNVIVGNTLKFTFGGATTLAVPYSGNAATDAANIQAKLNALSTIGGLTPFAGNVQVSANYTDTVFTITFGGYLADSAQALITGTVAAGTSILQAGASVAPQYVNTGVGFPTLVYTVTFSGSAFAGKAQSLITATPSVPGMSVTINEVALGNAGTVVANNATLQLDGDPTHSGIPAGISPNQILDIFGYGETTLTTTGNITAGTFKLTVGNQTTAAINGAQTPTALATDIQNKLAALVNVGFTGVTPNVTVTPSSTNNTYTIAFASTVATPVVYLASTTGLVGGTVAVSTPGALENLSGNNTWAGAIVLPTSLSVTTDAIGVDPTSQLTVTGMIQDPTTAPVPPSSVVPATLAKVGTGTLVLASQSVSSARITAAGAGYTSTPTVTFSAPPSGTTATGTAVIQNGVLVGITITNPGSGYLTAPTITLTGGGFTTAATATAVVGNSYTGSNYIDAGAIDSTEVGALGINNSTEQQVTLSGTSGTFTLGFVGYPITVVTPALSVNPITSAAALQTALNSSSMLGNATAPGGGTGTATVTALSSGSVFVVTFGGSLTGVNVPLLKKITTTGNANVAVASLLTGGASATYVDSAALGGAASGGSLQLPISIPATATTFKPLTLNGPGANNAGALEAISGNDTFAVPITLGSNASIGADTGAQLTLANPISDGGAGYAVNIVSTPTAAGVPGTGIVEYNASAANAYTGATTVLSGTLELADATSGGAVKGALVVGGNTAINQVQQIALSGFTTGTGQFTLTYNGVTTAPITYFSNSAYEAAQIQAALNAVLTPISVTVVSPSANVFNISLGGSIAGTDPAFLLSGASATGTVTPGVILTHGVIAQANSAEAQLLASNQINPLSTVTVNADGLFDLNDKSQSISGLTINSDGFAPYGTASTGVSGAGGGALTVTGPVQINVGRLNLSGPNDTVTVNGATASVTLNGGTINEPGAGSKVNVTGPVNVAGGIVNISGANSQFNDTGVLTQSAGAINLTNTNSQLNVNGSMSMTAAAVVTEGGTGDTATITGPLSEIDSSIIIGGSNNQMIVTGLFTVIGTDINGTFNLFGPTAKLILDGNVVGGSDASGNATIFGSGTVVLNDATTPTVTVNPSGVLLISAPITGSQGLTKLGTGQLELAGADNYGTTTINAGNVQVDQLGVQTLTLTGFSAGQQFALTYTGDGFTNQTTGTINFVGDGTGAGTAANILLALNNLMTSLGLPAATVAATGTPNIFTITFTAAAALDLVPLTGASLPAATAVSATNVNTTGAVVLNGGYLNGTGTVGAITSSAAAPPNPPLVNTINPGASAAGSTGILQVNGNVTWSPGTTLYVDLNHQNSVFPPVAGADYDQINVNGSVNLGGALLSGSITPNVLVGDSFTILTVAAGQTITGNLSGMLNGVQTIIPRTNGFVFFGSPQDKFQVTYNTTSIVLQRVLKNVSIVISAVPSGEYPTSIYGQDIQYQATVTTEPGAGNLTAGSTLTFTFDKASLGYTVTYVIPGGSSTFTTPLYDPQLLYADIFTPGSANTIDAAFSDTAVPPTFNNTTSVQQSLTELTQNVSQNTTNIALTSNPVVSPSSPVYGQNVTVTATITPHTPLTLTGAPATITAASELGTTVTITTAAAHNFAVGQLVTITGVAPAGYDGAVLITGTTATTFTYTAAAGLGAATLGTALATPAPVFTPTGNATFTLSGSTGTTTYVAAITNSGNVSAAPTATWTIPANLLAVGFLNTVQVTYGGDTYYESTTAAGGTGVSIVLPIQKNSSVVAISATPTALTGSTFGQQATFTATVTANAQGPNGVAPTGTVSFYDGATVPTNLIGTGTLVGGQTTVSTSTLSVFTHTINVVYNGDNNYTGNSNSILYTVNPAPTQTTFVSESPSPSNYGQSVVLTAQVLPNPGINPALGLAAPTGLIKFWADAVNTGTFLGSGTVSATGLAAATTAALSLTQGSHSLYAVYVGDSNYVTSTGTLSSFQVNPALTTTTLTASPVAGSSYGQAITLTAAVTFIAGVPTTGSVTFVATIPGTPPTVVPLGTANVNAQGKAILTPAIVLPAATYSITASYTDTLPDTNFGPSSNSPALSYTVSKSGTTTAVSATPATTDVFGESVTFTATISPVAPGAGTPADGTLVQFKDGTIVLGSGSTVSGKATFTTSSLTVGFHNITATFPGDGNFNTSTGTLSSFPVSKASTSAALTATPATGDVVGESVTFTDTVAAVAPGVGIPTDGDLITFKDGLNVIGTGSLAGGVATLTLSTLSVGTHSITAYFPGDGNFNTVTSPVDSYTVGKAQTTTAVSANPAASSVYGQSVSLSATVAAVSPGSGTPTNGDVVTFKTYGTTVSSVLITSPGSGFTSAPAVTFAAPASGTTATGFATISGGVLTGITITNPGSGYTAPPAITLIGGGFTTAASAQAVLPTVTLGTGTTNNGVAVLNIANLSVGSHTIFASFAGDANYQTSTGNLNNSPANNYTVTAAPTTTTVSVTPTSGDTYGQPVTFTANVVVVSPGAGTPANGDIVDFQDNGASIGTAVLANGQASLTITTLPAGTHGITAVFHGAPFTGGDPNFASSVGLLNGSASNNYTVGQAGTTTSLSASPSSNDTYGQAVTLTAAVSVNFPGVGTPPNGDVVSFYDGVTLLGSPTITNGVATLTTSSLIAGSHTLNAVFSGDTNYATSAGYLGNLSSNNFTVNQSNTLTTLTATPISGDVSGEAVTFTAAVSAIAPGVGVPANGDIVTFKDGNTTLGNGTINNGLATFTTSALSVGTHSITATFVGDGNFATSAAGLNGSPFNNYTVGQASTTATVTATPSSGDVFGQSVTFTATIAANAPGAGTPANGDTITFLDNGTAIGTGALSGGVATFTTSTLIVGNHTITASFAGDTNFTGSTGSLNGVSFNNFIVGVAGTTTTVTASQLAGVVVGQSVTFTAAVSVNAPGTGVPANGEVVTFKDGNTTLGTGTVSGGVATFTTSSLAVGPHTIKASYPGDANLATSTGNLANLANNNFTVNQANTTTTMTAVPPTSIFGQAVTFSAAVSVNFPGSGTPANGDTVSFYDGSTFLGTGHLASGIATYSTANLIVGLHSITATFAGDASFIASTGGLNNVTVNNFTVTQPQTTTTVSASPNTTVFGQSVTFTANIAVVAPGVGTPANGDTVNFFDAGNPIGSGTLTNGVATLTTLSLGAGQHTITATFVGDANYAPSSGNLNLVASNNFTVSPDPVHTTLTASPATGDVFGDSVTFTAALIGAAPGSGTPADGGTVTFKDGNNVLGTGILVSGVATYTTNGLSVGLHNLTASFPGDANFAPSTGALNNYSVANATTAIAVSATPSTGDVFGRAVGLTATITSGTTAVNGGTVSFYLGTVSPANLLGTSSAVVNGSAFITTSNTVLPVSAGVTIIANYSGTANIAASTGSLTNYAIGQANTTTVLTSSAPISGFGQSVTFTANVTANSPSTATVNGGIVTFQDNGLTIGTGTVSNGVATLSTTALAQLPALHSITAIYNVGGTGNFATSTSAPITQSVLAATTTTVTLNPSTAVQFGQTITYTIKVTSTTAGTPTGTINLYNGAVSPGNLLAGPLTLVGGSVSGTLPALSVGAHTINAVYSGNAVYAPSTGSTNPTVNPSLSATVLTVSPASGTSIPVYGQPVNLTAVVTAAFGGSPTSGVVTFTDTTTNTTLGTATLAGSNIATFTTTALSVATHTITATYGGITNDATSNGSVTGYVVHQASTTTALVSSAQNAVFGQPVTFSATVTANSPSTVAPTIGTVTFKDGNTVIAIVALSGSNTATFTTSSLAVATHSITASYVANSSYGASAASAITQIVSVASTTTALTASVPGGSQYGQSVTFSATITVAGGSVTKPTGTVKFYDGAVLLTTVNLSGTSNVATYTTAALAVNPSHTIQAVFTSNNANVTGSTGTLSPYSVTTATTTTTLTSYPAGWSVGAPISFTATIAANGGGAISTGTVTFVDTATNTTLGSAKVTSGKAVLSFAGFTSTGLHSVVATYSGGANFAGSSSTALTQNIVQVALTSSASPALVNSFVTFNATVTGAGGTPTGTVTFYSGTKILGTATLNGNGLATLAYKFTTAGTYKITAVYNGDSTFSTGGTPAALTESIVVSIGGRLT